jgi:hypothetical protein
LAKNDQQWEIEPWIRNFLVDPIDPGFIYIIEDSGRYKIGRSKDRGRRIQEAKTWLPNMRIVGVKPFWDVMEKEKLLHIGFAFCWYEGEWFVPLDEGYKSVLVDDFQEFSDTDINKNSVDFIYWYNSSGLCEFVMEQNNQRVSIHKFLRQETAMRKAD